MIKTFTEAEGEHLKMNIVLRDGRQYLGCHICEAPFKVEGTVGFWDENALTIIPLDTVASISLYSEE